MAGALAAHGVGRRRRGHDRGRQPARVGVRDARLLADRRGGAARARSSCGPADLRARMESVEPAAVVADARDLDLVSRERLRRARAGRAGRAPVEGRAGGGGGASRRPPRPDRLHLRHRGRAEADPPRPRLPERSERAGRALVRRASGRAVLVHRRQRLVAVGAQRLRGRLAARCGRAAARRALRSRGAARAARPGARERAVHVAHRVPRDREAVRRFGRPPDSATPAPPASRSTPRWCARGRRARACRSTTATARRRPAT